jgi:transcriptional regulator with XRE-family HTH domain
MTACISAIQREERPADVSASERDTAGPSLFVAELVAARTAAGLSQEALATQINYSPSLIGMIESGRRAPTLDVAGRLDQALKTTGTLARLQKHARTMPLPSWFRPYADAESTATMLRSWQPMVVDGLLQSEEYARAVLATKPNTTTDVVDEMVAARMDRQLILDQDKPPILWIVADEAVLHRLVGSPRIMHEQLMHVAGLAERPNVNVEIVPASAGAHIGLLGAFAVAEAGDKARVGYLETVTNGVVAEDEPTLRELMLAFDTLRGEALPRGASRDLILKEAARWT